MGPPPSVVPSSLPRSTSFPLCVATGVTRSVLPTRSPARCPASAVPSSAVSSRLPVVPASSLPTPKKVLGYAGIDDCFSSSRGATSTGGNFVKAVFAAVKATYGYNFPDLWEQTDLQVKKPPFQGSPTTSRLPRSRHQLSRPSSKRFAVCCYRLWC